MRNLIFPLTVFAFLAACKPVQKCAEKLDPACSCMEIYQPVCGCNGKTYGNECMAKCAGIHRFKKGECPTSPLTGVTWILKTFAVGPNPEKVPKEVRISATFEKDNVAGLGGCNSFGAGYTLGNDGRLTVSGVRSTKMFCENQMKWESMYFQMLEKSRLYRINGNSLEIDCGDMGALIFEKEN